MAELDFDGLNRAAANLMYKTARALEDAIEAAPEDYDTEHYSQMVTFLLEARNVIDPSKIDGIAGENVVIFPGLAG